MLVLSRLKNETVIIGEDIEVTVIDVRGDKVRLGINAPRNVRVDRKEVHDAIRAQNKDAARMQPGDLTRAPKTPPPSPARTS
jgi:carbon storage regulator